MLFFLFHDDKYFVKENIFEYCFFLNYFSYIQKISIFFYETTKFILYICRQNDFLFFFFFNKMFCCVKYNMNVGSMEMRY